MLRRFQPDLDFRIVAGAGHWVPYEAPDQVNAMLIEMLGGGHAGADGPPADRRRVEAGRREAGTR